MTEVYVRKPGFAVPIEGSKVPTSEAWLHEIKHDRLPAHGDPGGRARAAEPDLVGLC